MSVHVQYRSDRLHPTEHVLKRPVQYARLILNSEIIIYMNDDDDDDDVYVTHIQHDDNYFEKWDRGDSTI